MATDTIKVSTTKLKSDAQKIDASLRTIKKAMDNINADVSALNRMWEGLAKESFNNSFNNDKQKLNLAIAEIQTINKFQLAAVTAYETCEKQIENLTSGLKI